MSDQLAPNSSQISAILFVVITFRPRFHDVFTRQRQILILFILEVSCPQPMFICLTLWKRIRSSGDQKPRVVTLDTRDATRGQL